MKTVFVGNSHLGAIKRAYEAEDAGALGGCTFFGVPGPIFSKMSLTSDGAFAPADAGLLDQEEAMVRKLNGRLTQPLSDADLVVVVGLYPFKPEFLERLLSNFDVDTLRVTGAQNRLSYEAFQDLLSEKIDQYVETFRFPDLDQRYAIVPRPRVSQSVLELPAYKSLMDDPAGLAQAYRIIDELWTKKIADDRIVLVPHPETALDTSGLTQAVYSINSRRLSGGNHEETDRVHMNENYGRHALSQVIDLKR